MNESINLKSIRAKKARLAKMIGSTGARTFQTLGYLLILIGTILTAFQALGFGFISLSVGLGFWMIYVWYARELSMLPSKGTGLTARLSGGVLGQLHPNKSLTPQSLWEQLSSHWQGIFITNRLLLHSDTMKSLLSSQEADTQVVMLKASELTTRENARIDVGHVITALLLTSDPIKELCNKLKLQPDDIVEVLAWLERSIQAMRVKSPYFGGIGRDWANGFTPRLNTYGTNISQSIQRNGAHFGSLTTSSGVLSLKNNLSQGASAVALIGEPGSGKTSHIYALAQSLLAESRDPKLRHRQFVGLDASAIIANARQPGELEHIVLSLIHEASHAGNIILFFDNAQLFLRDGHGSFDATKLLLSVTQSKSLQIVLAMTPRDLQQLKADNPTFAGNLASVVLKEPDEVRVRQILEDTALTLEHQQKVVVTYESIKEAYVLSNRYMQDRSHPGKAITLLQQSLPNHNQGTVTASSIQRTIESTQGVKLSGATQAESDQLLNLEDDIHKRMINQTRAVKVVANALRRARAGVGNTNRPIGTFLFLGPTGVGKTELAKAVSATYFGNESAMIRLDMSEYQQADDVKRLLSDGTSDAGSLIMSVRKQPYSVVLLDEIEKAHPNILNLLLQLLDEGQLTDSAGKPVSFRDCIIITTSNAGAQTIRTEVEKGNAIEDFEQTFTDELINSGQFKPELLNRYDEIVLFRPLNQEELGQVVMLMLGDVNKTLASQNISVALTPEAVSKIVQAGYDPRLGARPMRRMIQRTIEDTVATRILQKQVNPGDQITLTDADINPS